MSKVGNQTNSQDPQAVNSRTFVGNLNTFQCTKTDVERMFQRYGKIAGISMHKGYAFVQFTNPFDARSACMGEDGRNVFGQILDVNLVAEPKPHQIGRKRPNVAKAAADWEQFYDSYNAGAALAGGPAAMGARLTPPLKRPRLVVPSVRHQQRSASPKKIIVPGIDDLRTYSSPDILICGNCRELFSSLNDFLDHRRQYCKLRFTCKCSSFNGTMSAVRGSVDGSSSIEGDIESASLMCALCKESFASAWDLMVHAQAAHMVNIYQLSNKESSQEHNAITGPGNDLAIENSSESGDIINCPSSNSSQEHDQTNKEIKENGLVDSEESTELMNGTGVSPLLSTSRAHEAMVTE